MMSGRARTRVGFSASVHLLQHGCEFVPKQLFVHSQASWSRRIIIQCGRTDIPADPACRQFALQARSNRVQISSIAPVAGLDKALQDCLDRRRAGGIVRGTQPVTP